MTDTEDDDLEFPPREPGDGTLGLNDNTVIEPDEASDLSLIHI